MIFNQSNITNRTVLARCCFADMVIDMLEARAIGDTDTVRVQEEKGNVPERMLSERCVHT
jgi:hypothetical protein